jgi:hypothetical protein
MFEVRDFNDAIGAFHEHVSFLLGLIAIAVPS